jgi:hypothetical protein
MEKHNLDNFFAKKLAGHEIAAGTETWDKISKVLDKKQRIKTSGWLSIAATAALLITSGYLIIQSISADNEDYVVKTINIDIEPDVPVYETQLPVFIRQHDDNSLASADQNTTINLTNQNQNKPDHVTLVSNEQSVATTENSNIKPILDSELLLVQPILIGSESDLDHDGMNKKEEQPVLLASSKEIVSQPVTIIYKQGEVKEKSKISKALNFMGEVGNREKKLLDIGKIKTSLFSKNKKQVKNSR